jgi:protein-L-isoaspartate(D-aspartate) O-methyltransferase
MDNVEKAFQDVPRKNFIPDRMQRSAYLDMPLPIGFGQTISQPSTVKKMLEWLEVEPGNKVLDVGSGSGWTTALLSNIVGRRGKVFAVEKIPELVEFGRQNNRVIGNRKAEFHQAGEVFGLLEHAPYDRILVSAAADELPHELIEQLAKGGKLVIPVLNDILEIEKDAKGHLDIKSHPGFVFVPLVK